MLISAAALAIAVSAFAPGRLFDTREVLALRLEAPLNDLFAHAEKEDYTVVGRLAWEDPVSGERVVLDDRAISIRGNTSRRPGECDFPKLKVSLQGADLQRTALEGLQSIKLGTHCGDRADGDLTPKYGRLANERSAHREALVYAMLHAAGVPTLHARPARATYVFTDAPAARPLVRDAFVLEDDDDAKARLGATSAIGEEQFTSARDVFAPRDTATLAFGQALVGNFDWCLRMFPGDIYRCDDRRPLWNVLAFARPNDTVVPVIYDFDLAGPVVGRHPWFRQVFDTAITPSGSETVVEVVAQVQRTRSLFGRPVLDDARRRFRETRAAVLAAIEQASVDDAGRELARRHASAFYDAITDEAFYRPVIAEGGVFPALDAAASRPACPEGSPAPAGTLVGDVLEREGDMVRVRLLDVLWQWTGSRRCDIVHRQPVWIPANAVSPDYPR